MDSKYKFKIILEVLAIQIIFIGLWLLKYKEFNSIIQVALVCFGITVVIGILKIPKLKAPESYKPMKKKVKKKTNRTVHPKKSYSHMDIHSQFKK